MAETKESPLAGILKMAACFVVVVAGMRAASTILVPFLLAVFVAVITTPAFFALQRKGIPSALALIIMILTLLVVGVAGGSVIGRSITSLKNRLPQYQERLQVQTRQAVAWLSEKGINVSEEAQKVMNPGSVMRMMSNTLAAAGGILSNTFIILLISIFILFEAAVLPSKVRSMPGLSEDHWNRLQTIVTDIRQYMGLKTVMSVVTGVCITSWAYIMGIDAPILLGLMAFILNYVPNIGSILASIPGVILALVQYDLTKASIAAAGYLVINIGISNLLEPRFMGKGLGVSPMFIVISMVFWGWVLGPVGMLLAVPLTMTLKIAMESNPDTKWIGTLLGAKVPKAQRSGQGTDAAS